MSKKWKLRILFIASVCIALLAVFNMAKPLTPKTYNDPQIAVRQLYNWDSLNHVHF